MANNILKTTELIEKATTILVKHAEILEKSAVSLSKLNTEYKKVPSEYIKAIKDQEVLEQQRLKTQQQSINVQQKLTDLKAKEARDASAELSLKKKKEQAEKAENNAIKAKIPTLRQLAAIKRSQEAQAKREQRNLEKTTGLYNRIQQAINKVTKKYQDLAVRKQLGGKLSAKEERQLISLQAKLLKYNNALKKVDSQIGRNQRNVGNYKSALTGLGGTLRSLAGAFGLTSGVFLFAQGIKDAFNRIREFDKAMQNIAGIMRTTRGELKDLEAEIIKVAGSSIKTSREVANLAENLVTLGKTKSEIIDLLEPVNNLAIGLDTTSGEAAEFLVQTLNAFGAGSDEAAQYADTIATIRTSTSLDFQKMRDSFQYLAPISKILNKDLAYTGALIGVVADRGIKAEQAGRLLGTAQMRLASQGKTLIQGLEELNEMSKDAANETESLAFATEMFGVNAAKVGVTLAGAIEKVGEYEDRINSSKGALDDLVNQQLESLDAKILILDSSYEKFILSLEEGNSFMSKYVKRNIEDLANSFDMLARAMDDNTSMMDSMDYYSKAFGNTLRQVMTLGLFPFNQSVDESVIKQEELRDEIQKQTKAYIELYGSIGPLTDEQVRLNEATADYFLLFKDTPIKEESESVADLRKRIRALNKEIDISDKTDIKGIRIKQKKIKELQKELDAILGVTRGVKKNTKAKKENNKVTEDTFGFLKGTIPYYEEIINGLKEQQLQVSRNTDEWFSYQKQIDQFTESLIKLKRELTGDYSDSEGTDAAEKMIDAIVNAFKLKDGAKEDIEDSWKDTFQTVTDVARRAFGIITALSDASFEKQFSDLEAQKENAILFAGDSAVARANIEEQYNEKRKKIEKQQAKAKKEQALFDITVDTASAVVRALPNIPLAVIVGALGAAQLALVASQQLPAFWQGGEVGGSQQIMVNDDPFGRKGSNYKEVIEKPNGQILTPQGKNVKMTVPKGSYVHPTYDAFINSLDSELLTNNIMPIGQSNIAPMIINQGLNKSDVLDIMTQHGKSVVSAINNKESFYFNYDERGAELRRKKKGKISVVMNARYSGKGLGV